MGTGVNAQLRLRALHHLDVPWLPSQIEQREGRILRQGNQHDVVDIFAYATEGSMDAQMWQNNERKARFIAAALSGDTSVRRLEDLGDGQANQFAMAKAIASGDPRLMQKAGLEADIARLERLRSAHQDDQFAIRRQIRDAERDIEYSTRRIGEIGEDLARLVPTTGEAFRMRVEDKTFTERKLAGRALMTEVLTLVQLQHAGEVVCRLAFNWVLPHFVWLIDRKIAFATCGNAHEIEMVTRPRGQCSGHLTPRQRQLGRFCGRKTGRNLPGLLYAKSSSARLAQSHAS
jgi:hypothetical protein